jgi:hypothetical protein
MAARIQPNPDLVCVFRKNLLRHFGQHGDWDPWWWPVAPAKTLQDWGLQDGEDAVLQSLRNPAEGRDYSGFQGSIGAMPGGTWVISTRPSQERSFPRAIGPMYGCLRNADMIQEAHVTDLAKFRGAGPDSLKNEGMTPIMWECSIQCLQDEYALLKPARVLFIRGAKCWFGERKAPINPASEMRCEWRRDPARQHLDTFLTNLENHANSAVVSFWRAPNAAGCWRTARLSLR